VKSTFHSAGPQVRSFRGLNAAALIAALALLLAGCGQKGPLYLAKPPPERTSAVAPAATPAPASTPLKADDPAISLPASK